MKTIRRTCILALTLAFVASAQSTTTLNLTLTFATGVFQDIVTYWCNQRGNTPLGTLSAAQAAGDASITVGQQVTIPAGSTVLIVDAAGTAEPEALSAAVAGSATIPVLRSLPGVTAAAHASGAAVYLLTYSSPLAMMAAQVLQGWANNIVISLAAQGKSAIIPPLSGTFTIQ